MLVSSNLVMAQGGSSNGCGDLIGYDTGGGFGGFTDSGSISGDGYVSDTTGLMWLRWK